MTRGVKDNRGWGGVQVKLIAEDERGIWLLNQSNACERQASQSKVWVQLRPSMTVPQAFLFHILNSTEANAPSRPLPLVRGLQQKQAAAPPGLYLSLTHAGQGGPAAQGFKGEGCRGYLKGGLHRLAM